MWLEHGDARDPCGDGAVVHFDCDDGYTNLHVMKIYRSQHIQCK